MVKTYVVEVEADGISGDSVCDLIDMQQGLSCASAVHFKGAYRCLSIGYFEQLKANEQENEDLRAKLEAAEAERDELRGRCEKAEGFIDELRNIASRPPYSMEELGKQIRTLKDMLKAAGGE